MGLKTHPDYSDRSYTFDVSNDNFNSCCRQRKMRGDENMKIRIVTVSAVLMIAGGSQAHAGIRCTSSGNTNLGSAITIDIPGSGRVVPPSGVATVHQIVSKPVKIAEFAVDVRINSLPNDLPITGGPTFVTAQDKKTGGAQFFLTFNLKSDEGNVRFLLGGDTVVHEKLNCEVTPEIERPRRNPKAP